MWLVGSACTLHVIWPFLWIWTTRYRAGGWGFQGGRNSKEHIEFLEAQVARLSERLQTLERREPPKPESSHTDAKYI